VEKQQSKSIFVPKTKYYSKLVISVEGWPFFGCSLVSAPPCYYTVTVSVTVIVEAVTVTIEAVTVVVGEVSSFLLLRCN
jgi:hypothetical protein